LFEMPEEIQTTIFSFLTHNELCNLSMVCRSLNRISHDPQLWKHLYRQHFSLPRVPACKSSPNKNADWVCMFEKAFRVRYKTLPCFQKKVDSLVARRGIRQFWRLKAEFKPLFHENGRADKDLVCALKKIGLKKDDLLMLEKKQLFDRLSAWLGNRGLRREAVDELVGYLKELFPEGEGADRENNHVFFNCPKQVFLVSGVPCVVVGGLNFVYNFAMILRIEDYD